MEYKLLKLDKTSISNIEIFLKKSFDLYLSFFINIMNKL